MSTSQQPTLQHDARALSNSWRTLLKHAATPQTIAAIQHDSSDLTIEALAEFVAAALQAGQTLLVVVPDDDWLPEISNALDLSLRPLCLVLPGQGFAAGIALRATLALLKSRLSRAADAAWGSVWEAQRTRLQQHEALWQLTLKWSSNSNSTSAGPSQVDELFPVCVLPQVQAETLAIASRDLVLVLHSNRMGTNSSRLQAVGRRTLLLLQEPVFGPSALRPIDEQCRLNAEYEILAQELGDMELEFATVQAELGEFTRDYHSKVGTRMIELDSLQARIARCQADRSDKDEATQQQADQAQAQAETSRREHARFAELDLETEKPFVPTGGLKRLFRQLAQKIHPDRAESDEDRTWRTELMSEANRAYRAGDEMVLREILAQWQAGKRRPPPSRTRDTATSGLAEQVSRMQRRLAEIEIELNRLFASRLYELFVAAGMARQRGRELLDEMAEQLDLEINLARQRLQQLEST